MKFYDTCSLLKKANTLFEDKELFAISSITLEELENIKTSISRDTDIKYSARVLLRKLDAHNDEYSLIVFKEDMLSPIIAKNLPITNDTKILATALYCSADIFVTNDLALKAMAKIFFTNIESVPEEIDDTYTGYKEITLTEHEMAAFYENQEAQDYGLLENEYLLIYNTDGVLVDRKVRTADGYRNISYREFDSEELGTIRPMSNDPQQQCVADSFLHNQITLVKGPAGSGKAQPNNTQIPTPNGYKNLGALKVGDYVYNRQGIPTKIIGVFPQGIIDNYKITFSDGRVAYCNDEHIWSCFTSKGNLKNFTVKEMLNKGLLTNHGAWRYKIPMNGPIEYPTRNYDIDPYVMGAFLGDGCCCEKALTISSSDEEIVSEIAKLIGAKQYGKSTEFNYNWNFYLPDNYQYYTDCGNLGQTLVVRYQTKQFFKQYSDEVLCKAYNKHIPSIYKYGSIEQRYHLLQGLMDTDGHIDNAIKGRTSFTSTSYQLILDLQEICWSLGLKASIITDNRVDKYTNHICYSLIISCKKDIKPNLFRLKRKKNIAIEYANNTKASIYSNTLTIKNIEKLPNPEPMTCIYVEDSEHLYLTEQYIVTHNTLLSLGFLFSQLERHKIDKIIVFCNTVAAKNAAKLGYLPGNRNEKLLDSQIGNLLISKLGSRAEVERLISEEKLLLLPMADIRGYDTSGMRAGIYISEAQNLDIPLMKLALQRIGDDSICIIDGDAKAQVDDVNFAGSNNGLRRVSKVFRGHDIYGEIELKQIHRSKIGLIAEDM